ncbi:MAG: hypothetical protein BWY42_00951 [Candidatus Omnitrophica bacterium ADurb.Bin277]|jgi:hypothetical protein|nr:MAG: hypothetical protein BWY42_00951 [Candidatus Omnitrophica bacterium ADurb.Bin277]
MQKFMWVLVALLIMPGVVSAEFVNLAKVGTSWVWRVDNGLNAFTGVIMNEDDSTFVTEAGDRVRVEVNEYSYVFLESGDRFLTEKDEILLTDEFSAGNYSALYLQLLGQGWTLTESAATVPQGISEAQASSLRFALMEDGKFLVNENTNNLRLEN